MPFKNTFLIKCVFHHVCFVHRTAIYVFIFCSKSFLLAPQLVQHGNIDYLVFDYLSEITMSLLARMKEKNPVSTFSQGMLALLCPRIIFVHCYKKQAP